MYGTKPHVPDYFVMNDDIYRIITDHLGSVRLVVRVKDGSIVQEMVHDEFGKILSSVGAGFQPFGFAGGLYDYNTGFIQFGARWYDPQVGRWVSKDPIGFAGGDTNLYAYVGGNPVSYVDPRGFIGFVSLGKSLVNSDDLVPVLLQEGQLVSLLNSIFQQLTHLL